MSFQWMEKPIMDLKDRFFDVPPERIIQDPEPAA